MKVSKDHMEYFSFLSRLEDSFRKIKEPISKVIMKKRLGSHFNLSPDYSEKLVERYTKKAQEDENG